MSETSMTCTTPLVGILALSVMSNEPGRLRHRGRRNSCNERLSACRPTIPAVKFVVIEAQLADELRMLGAAAFDAVPHVENHEAVVPVASRSDRPSPEDRADSSADEVSPSGLLTGRASGFSVCQRATSFGLAGRRSRSRASSRSHRRSGKRSGHRQRRCARRQ